MVNPREDFDCGTARLKPCPSVSGAGDGKDSGPGKSRLGATVGACSGFGQGRMAIAGNQCLVGSSSSAVRNTGPRPGLLMALRGGWGAESTSLSHVPEVVVFPMIDDSKSPSSREKPARRMGHPEKSEGAGKVKKSIGSQGDGDGNGRRSV